MKTRLHLIGLNKPDKLRRNYYTKSAGRGRIMIIILAPHFLHSP